MKNKEKTKERKDKSLVINSSKIIHWVSYVLGQLQPYMDANMALYCSSEEQRKDKRKKRQKLSDKLVKNNSLGQLCIRPASTIHGRKHGLVLFQ